MVGNNSRRSNLRVTSNNSRVLRLLDRLLVQVVLTVSVQSLMTLMSVTVLQTVFAVFLGMLTGTVRQIGAEAETGLTPVEPYPYKPASASASASASLFPTILELCLVWELVCSHFVVVVV